VTARELYEQHLAKAAPGTPLAAAFARVPAGTASVADLVAYAEWELWEAMYSLPLDDKPKPSDEHPRGLDVSHANACTFRAIGALTRLQRLLGAKP